jgi:hypothetical protein
VKKAFAELLQMFRGPRAVPAPHRFIAPSESHTMRTRTTLAAAAVLAAGALLGWLAASGRLALAQDKPGQPKAAVQPPAFGDVLPKPPQPFRGTINLRAKDSSTRNKSLTTPSCGGAVVESFPAELKCVTPTDS